MEEPDVLEGALRIAQAEYPELDIAAYLRQVEELALEARARVTGVERQALDRFNDHFFGRLGFAGNKDDYYDPRNAYLNDVIDRRTGIPITLSTLYCEIGQKIGLPTFGVGFPCRFLAKARWLGTEILVDCYEGRVLTREDCQDLLETLVPGNPRLDEAMFEVSTPRKVLARILNNLRHMHMARQDYGRVVRWITLDLELRPHVAENYRDRGMVYIQMEEFGKGVVDLERYAAAAPKASDLPQVTEQIQLLKKLLSHLN